MKRRISGSTCLLVKPLAGYMLLANHGTDWTLCAAFITVFGGYAAGMYSARKVHESQCCFQRSSDFAAAQASLRYAEQACNHFIAFKLLALIRERFLAPCAACVPLNSKERIKVI